MDSFGREYGWDDAIQNDSEFQILPEGDYNFTVVSFERGRHEGSEKLPPCNKAILKLRVSDGVHEGTVEHVLFLHSKCEGLLCEFFTAIGQRKHGESIVPKWNQLVGSSGVCSVKIDIWQGRNGEMKSNKIRRFYEKDAGIKVKPIAQAPAQPQSGYTAGEF